MLEEGRMYFVIGHKTRKPRKFFSLMPPQEILSEYELQREENILQNKRRLFHLGLGPNPDEPATKVAKQVEPPKVTSGENVAVRRSERTKNTSTVFHKLDDIDGIDEIDRYSFEEYRATKKHKKKKEKKPEPIEKDLPNTCAELHAMTPRGSIICPECLMNSTLKVFKFKGLFTVKLHQTGQGAERTVCQASNYSAKALAKAGKYPEDWNKYLLETHEMSLQSQDNLNSLLPPSIVDSLPAPVQHATAQTTCQQQTVPPMSLLDSNTETASELASTLNTDHIINDLILSATDVETLLEVGKHVFAQEGEVIQNNFVEKVRALA